MAFQLIGSSPAFRQVLDAISTIAPVDSPVLLLGETGTGKEFAARAIHAAGARRTQGFVAVNCAAIPAGLTESELFGYERGAFTGAAVERDHILETLQATNWAIGGWNGAAARLGLSRTTLIATMQQLGVSRESGPRADPVVPAHRNVGDPRWRFGRGARSTRGRSIVGAIANSRDCDWN